METYQLAQRIRAFRKLKGFTQNELADKMGVSLAVLGSIERGTRKPDVAMLQLICDTLGVAMDELAGPSTESYSPEV